MSNIDLLLYHTQSNIDFVSQYLSDNVLSNISDSYTLLDNFYSDEGEYYLTWKRATNLTFYTDENISPRGELYLMSNGNLGGLDSVKTYTRTRYIRDSHGEIIQIELRTFYIPEKMYIDFNVFDVQTRNIPSGSSAQVEMEKFLLDYYNIIAKNHYVYSENHTNKYLLDILNQMNNNFNDFTAKAYLNFADINTSLDNKINSLSENLSNYVDTKLSTLSKDLKDEDEKINNRIDTWVNAISSVISSIEDNFQTEINDITTSINTKISNINNDITNMVDDKLSEYSDNITSFGSLISSISDTLQTQIDYISKTTIPRLDKNIFNLDEKISNLDSSIFDIFSNPEQFVGLLYNLSKLLEPNLINTIKNIITKILS